MRRPTSDDTRAPSATTVRAYWVHRSAAQAQESQSKMNRLDSNGIRGNRQHGKRFVGIFASNLDLIKDVKQFMLHDDRKEAAASRQ
jgi:hypothetical protein